MFKNLIPWRHKREKRSRHGDLMTTPARGELARFREDFGSLLDRFYGDGPAIWDDLDQWNVGWGCDVEDADKEIVVRAEAPGFDPDEIEVRVSGNRLVLHAEHKEEKNAEDGHSMHYGQFHREMTLPRGIEADNIKAEYKRGIVEVRLPKGPEAQTKRIPVKTKL